MSKKSKKMENWASDQESDVYKHCLKFYEKINSAYKNRKQADDAIKDYWCIYNAEIDNNQTYQPQGTAAYLPVVRDAINARAKRALRQLFPNKYSHVEAVGTDSLNPKAHLALLEHYIRLTKLKSIVRSMLVAGDVTGQWNVYLDWYKVTRNVTGMVKRNPELQDDKGLDLGIADATVEVDESDDSELTIQMPDVIDFATEDLAVIPPTCNDINRADITCLKLRMSKGQVKHLVDDGLFVLPEDSDVSDWVSGHKPTNDERNAPKDRTDDAGIKTTGTTDYVLIYWAQAYVEFEKGKRSLADVYFAGENDLIGIVKAPQWGQKRSILSAPVERVAGSFHGISRIEPVKTLQWGLNDFWNMGTDSATYAMMPIVMTDPEKNPNYAMMTLGLGAVWPTNPTSTSFASFPALWKDAAGMCENIKQQINVALDVNEMMLGGQPKGRKNAPMVGAQQQESSVAVIDLAERFEEEILNPLMELMFEYDAQFRDEELTVMTQGEIGIKAKMEVIPKFQWGERYFFQWTGTSFTMNTARIQQQISMMNVLRGIPPQQLNGLRLDVTPILENLVDNTYGVELGSKILIDERNMHTVPPEIEDEMLLNGIMVETHQADDDAAHITVHQAAAQKSSDPTGLMRTHIQKHMKQMQVKREAASPPPPQGQQGVPGGAAPGVAGTPRPGSQVAPQRPMQQPAGAIPQPQ